MAKHSRLGGSTSARWLTCTASPHAIEQAKKDGVIPKESTSSIYAEEGTAAHELLEKCLKSGLDAEDYFMKKINNFIVDEGMISAVQSAIDYIEEITNGFHKDFIILLEQKFSLSEYVGDDCGGSADVTIINIKTGDLFVFDYKHGKGVLVEVYGNTQLLLYALGIYRKFLKKYKFSKKNKASLIIGQPRAPHINGPMRDYVITIRKLVRWGEKVLIPAVQEINDPKKRKFCASQKACEWCPLIGLCPPTAAHNTELMHQEFSEFVESPDLPAPKRLTIEEAEAIVRHKSKITKWLSEVELYLFNAIESGTKSEHFKLVTRTGNRKYNAKQSRIIRKLKRLEVKEGYYLTEPGLRSPAQLEASLVAHTDMKLSDAKEFVNEVTERPDLGHTIAKLTDGRDRISSAEDDFKEVVTTKKPRSNHKRK